jgi:hypothetical protein
VVSFTLRPLYPGERARGIRYIGGWVDPRAGLDSVAKRRIFTSPCRELTRGRPTRSLVAILTELPQLSKMSTSKSTIKNPKEAISIASLTAVHVPFDTNIRRRVSGITEDTNSLGTGFHPMSSCSALVRSILGQQLEQHDSVSRSAAWQASDPLPVCEVSSRAGYSNNTRGPRPSR